jgi:type II secretory pathway component PulC
MRSRDVAMVLGLMLAMVGLAPSGQTARAESMNKSESTLVVRAWGEQGRSVERVRRAAKTDVGLPREVNGGVIPRAALDAELSNGIGRFLQQVRTQPVVSRGRFLGWRLMTLFPSRSDISVKVLRPGDTIVRVNGQSVERPEDFKELWDSMSKANELVLEIEREGEASTIRYSIK